MKFLLTSKQMKHLPVFLNLSAYLSFEKKKINHLAIAMISHKFNFAKINRKKFSQQIFYGIELSHTAIIELLGGIFLY